MLSLIRFRELNMEDDTKLYEIYADKEAMKYRGSKPMQSIEDARIFVRNWKKIEQEIITIRQGIELLKSKELIGSVMYRYDKNKRDECEIGYSIGRQYWGKGLGKVVVKTMVKLMEKEKEVKNIIAWSNKENIASIKILEGVGFKRINNNSHPNNQLYLKANN